MTTDTPLYLDPDRPIAERVQDLIGRLTLEEKAHQLINPTPAIPRLGIPAYDYWSEALHGVARNGRATVFPQAIGMAATWDAPLIERAASAIADEGRAKFHATLDRNGGTVRYQGLTFWSPNINIFRDPRWGRGQETWGEDPHLTGTMGAAFVRGLQGDDPRYLKAAACAKHYAVHSGPEGLRHEFDVHVSPRDLYDTYLPAFQQLVVEAKVESVMGAYNRVNGEAACASTLLLEAILRGEWGFEGHVVSDCGAIDDFHTHHHVTRDAAESAALAVRRGCDLNCGSTFLHLPAAVRRGLLTEAEVDRALTRALTTRFKLGLFDPPERVPWTSISPDVIGCAAHQALAHEVAARSVVLLKNKDNLLPLGSKLKSLYVLGPTALSGEALLGNYYGLSPSLTTLLEGIVGRLPEGVACEYRVGAQLAAPTVNNVDWVTGEAAQADVVVACMGITTLLEGEEGDALASPHHSDRLDLRLPAVQVDLLRKLAARGARIVLVLTGGSPIVLDDLADLVDAIVFVWYPGQAGGAAVADVLFGAASPSGKLPITFPKSVDQLPPFEDYRMAGRTYRYMTQEPLFPFGFGLSYTRFAYRDLRLATPTVKAGEGLDFQVTVANVGGREAEEIVQVYVSALDAGPDVPLAALKAFRRVPLAPGQAVTLDFQLPPDALTLVGADGQGHAHRGAWRITVGGCSPGPRGQALGAPAPVTAKVRVE